MDSCDCWNWQNKRERRPPSSNKEQKEENETDDDVRQRRKDQDSNRAKTSGRETKGKRRPAKKGERERDTHKKNEWDLPQLIGTVPVEADANVDGYDGEDDAEQDQRSSFTDGLDSDVDHNTHEGQQRRSVDPKIVVPHIGVDSWITKQGYLRCYVNLCVFIRWRAKSNQIKSNGSD